MDGRDRQWNPAHLLQAGEPKTRCRRYIPDDHDLRIRRFVELLWLYPFRQRRFIFPITGTTFDHLLQIVRRIDHGRASKLNEAVRSNNRINLAPAFRVRTRAARGEFRLTAVDLLSASICRSGNPPVAMLLRAACLALKLLVSLSSRLILRQCPFGNRPLTA